MWDLLQPLRSDDRVCKIFHGHFSDLHWLQSQFSIVVSPPIIDTAVIAQELDNMWEDGQPSLQMLCRQSLNHEFDETRKTTTWRQRPMPSDMLYHAAISPQVFLPLHAAMVNTMKCAWGCEAALTCGGG